MLSWKCKDFYYLWLEIFFVTRHKFLCKFLFDNEAEIKNQWLTLQLMLKDSFLARKNVCKQKRYLLHAHSDKQ